MPRPCPVTGGSSPPGTIGLDNSRSLVSPGMLELPSTWKRLRRLLLRWQAPQPHPAHREDGRTRPDSGTSAGTPNPMQDPTLDPTPAIRVPHLAFGEGVTAGKSPQGGPVARKNRGRLAPLGGEVRARLIHPSPDQLCGSRLRRRSIHSAGRLPHGALAISAHLRRAAALRAATHFEPYRGQARTERHRWSQADRHMLLAPLVTIHSPHRGVTEAVTIRLSSARRSAPFGVAVPSGRAT
jgi:hypothetical protein